MGMFDGLLICTDLDGTLLKKDKSISSENIEAIRHFKNEGGIFTFVTGRMPYFVSQILEKINPNAPFGCVNGAALYDGKIDDYIWKATMPDGVMELVKYVDDNFNKVGIQVNTFYKTYFCKENKAMKNFRDRNNLENLVCHYEEVREPIAKIIFTSDDEYEIAEMEKELKRHPISFMFDFIRSEKSLYEILPKGINKGTSLLKLCQYLNIDKNKIITMGDYNNDIPMFNVSKVSIAVKNACKDALTAAEYVTVSNEDNAIAQVILDLKGGKYF